MKQRSFLAEQPPLFVPLIAYSIGIAVPIALPAIISHVLIAIALSLILIFYLQKSSLLLQGAGLLFFLLLGNLLVRQQLDNFFHFFEQTKANVWNVHAQVEDTEKIMHPRYNHKVTLSVSHITDPQNNLHVPLNIIIHWYLHARREPLCAGQQITLLNVAFCQPDNHHYARYLCREGVQTTIFDPITFLVQDTQVSNSLKMLQETRKTTFATTCAKAQQRSKLLLSSLFFGKKPTDKTSYCNIKHYFAFWGLSHYLARSGLHLVMFILLWGVLLRMVPVRFVIKELMLVAIVLAYSVLSWSSISFLRAFWMFITYKLCNIFLLRMNILSIIILVAFFTLLTNPLHIFFLDFQLSFLLTYALGWIGSTRLKPAS